jgi:transcriptional regulator with XRE-family HTH domain
MKRATLLRQQRHYVNQVSGNPFKDLREELGLTLEVLAAKTGLSKQALIRNEQGTYAQPLPALLSFVCNNYGVKEHDFTRAYEDFQERTRRANTGIFGPVLPNPIEYQVYDDCELQHPFRTLRGAYNPSEVSKALCIPQATLNYFEHKPRSQKTVPKALLEVLAYIGYSYTELNYFMDAYTNYRLGISGNPVPAPEGRDLL